MKYLVLILLVLIVSCGQEKPMSTQNETNSEIIKRLHRPKIIPPEKKDTDQKKDKKNDWKEDWKDENIKMYEGLEEKAESI